MEKEKFEILAMEYLSGDIDTERKVAFEKLLKGSPEHQQEFNEMLLAWNQIEHLKTPEPSEEMDQQFYTMLYTQNKKEEKVSLVNKLKNGFTSIFGNITQPQLALGALLLCVGLSLGYLLKTNPSIDATTIVNKETEEIRRELVLTLLEQPSANKRLQGVSEANKFEKANDRVIKALLQTLNNDPNVNVRLAAIESLTNYLDNPIVREGLVQTIVKQKSPIVQVTLADLMVALQEKKSIEPFKKLMRTEGLDKSVKEKLETSIHSII